VDEEAGIAHGAPGHGIAARVGGCQQGNELRVHAGRTTWTGWAAWSGRTVIAFDANPNACA
jgi:hypothetical protein